MEALGELVGAEADRVGRRGTATESWLGCRFWRGPLRVARSWRTRSASGRERPGTAQAEAYLVVIGLDVVDRQPADGGWLLGVEQHEQSGEAVLGREGIVVEQPSGLFPAVLGVEDTGRPIPSRGREVQAGQLCFWPIGRRALSGRAGRC